MSERSSTVIPLPLSVVESNIWDVASWPTFLGDVEWARRVAHERYVFGVREGRRVHEVMVAVRWHPHDHRVTWREISGPVWRGELRLTSMNGRRTKVAMAVTVHPRSLLAMLVELVGGRHRDVAADLHRLAQRLSTIPQPFNPGRLAPSRQPAAHPGGTRAAAATRAAREAAPGQQDQVPATGADRSAGGVSGTEGRS